MNLRDLHYLVAVADLRNFSQAADQCAISQPTLSNQIKKLEETLSVQIFERTNKRVMLTEVGEQIVAAARRVLREEEAIRTIAAQARDPFSGNFRLGAFPTLSTYLFPLIVPEIRKELSKLRLILIEEKTAMLLDKLRSGELDAALIALPVQDEALQSEVLFKDPFLLAVPEGHLLAAHDKVTQEELGKYPLLLLEEGHCLRDQALDVCRLTGSQEQDFRATGLETLRQMVKAGTGITIMPQIAVREGEEGLVTVPFASPVPQRKIGLVWRKTSARGPVIQALAEIVKRVMGA